MSTVASRKAITPKQAARVLRELADLFEEEMEALPKNVDGWFTDYCILEELCDCLREGASAIGSRDDFLALIEEWS